MWGVGALFFRMNIHSTHKVEIQKVSRTKCMVTFLPLLDKPRPACLSSFRRTAGSGPSTWRFGISPSNAWRRAKEGSAGAESMSTTSQALVGSCLNVKEDLQEASHISQSLPSRLCLLHSPLLPLPLPACVRAHAY